MEETNKRNPKLAAAMLEINAILYKHDIAAVVVLHTPGYSEYTVHIGPSYSCARWEGNSVIVQSKAEDYGGDKTKQMEALANTCNMIHHFSVVPTGIGNDMKILEEVLLANDVPIEHGDTIHTRHNPN